MSALPVRSQKMKTLGTMAGGIAHDFTSMLFRTPRRQISIHDSWMEVHRWLSQFRGPNICEAAIMHNTKCIVARD
jgi:hypothetical protein